MENVPRKQSLASIVKEIIIYAGIALIIVVPVRLYIAQPFVVSGDSMDNTFRSGQYLIINELSYEFGAPKRGDVVIFKYPLNPKEYFIKRAIGLPEETVIIKNNTVTIKNAAHPEGFTLDEPYAKGLTFGEKTVTLSPNEYFVMGDNRLVSSDSRLWGPLSAKDLIGTPLVRLLPVTKAAFNPGKVNFAE